jgi:hypothetical protein
MLPSPCTLTVPSTGAYVIGKGAVITIDSALPADRNLRRAQHSPAPAVLDEHNRPQIFRFHRFIVLADPAKF